MSCGEYFIITAFIIGHRELPIYQLTNVLYSPTSLFNLLWNLYYFI